MKKHLVIALSLLFVSAVSLAGQEHYHFLNGYDWEKFSGYNPSMVLLMKQTFLRGVVDGANAENVAAYYALRQQGFDDDKADKIKDKGENSPMGAIFAGDARQIVEGVDEFYKDFANKHIPIFAIAKLVSKKISGQINEEDLAAELQSLRAMKWQ